MRHDRPVDSGPSRTGLPPGTSYRPEPDAGDFTQAAIPAWNPVSSVVKVPETVLSPGGVSWHSHILAHLANLRKEGVSLSSAG